MVELTLHIDEPFAMGLSSQRIEQAVRATLRLAQPTKTGSISVVVTDSQTVQQLNHQYRGIDAPTDVLSFENMPDPDFSWLESLAEPHLGDIIIAYPVAVAQAAAAGHTPAEEVVLLTVHGMLHLLGFDHDTAEGKAEMWAVQQQIMAELALAHVQPTET